MNTITLERLFEILKTYELKQEQQKELYGKGKVVRTSIALVFEAPEKMSAKVDQPYNTEKEGIIADYGETPTNQNDAKFYSMEDLELLEEETKALVARRFSYFRFRRNPNLGFKSTRNRFPRGGSSTSSSTRGGYKIGLVDRSKIRCYNYNEIGHFATECQKPKLIKRREYAPKKKKGSKA